VYSGNSLPTFRNNLTAPNSRVKKSNKKGTDWLSQNVGKELPLYAALSQENSDLHPPIQTVPGAVCPDAMHSECAPDQLLPFATMLQTVGVIPPFPRSHPWH
jgi:hypothetical protein